VDGVEAPTFGAEAQDCFVKYLQAQGVIEKPKLKRGRKAKAAEAVAEAVSEAETPTEDAAQQESTEAEVAADAPTEALVEAVALTLEDIPKRDEKGRLLSGESRRQMLADLQGEVA
jgi:3-oxoacyl-ACP reductase-like protein